MTKHTRLTAIITIIVMILSTSVTFAESEAVQSDIYTAEYLDSLTDTSQSVQFTYTDSMLDESSKIFSNELAIASMGLSFAAGNQTNDNIMKLLGSMGFSDFTSNYATKTERNDNVCVSYALKEMDNAIIIPVIIRGSHYEIEWVDNFHAGTEGDAAGYRTAADRVSAYVDAFISDKKINADKIKLWVVGYSRGGAIADLTGKILTEKYGADHVYGYCFEAPMTNLGNAGIGNIHHTRNVYDGVTCVLPAYMGWGIAGKADNKIGSGNLSEMLEELKNVTSASDLYTSPEGFCYAKLDVSKLITYISNPDTAVIPAVKVSNADLSKFWPVLLKKLENVIGTRGKYTSVYSDMVEKSAASLDVEAYTVEQSAMEIVNFIFSLDDAGKEALVNNIKNNGTSFFLKHLNVISQLLNDKDVKLSQTEYAALVKDLSAIVDADDKLKAAINGVLQPLISFVDDDLEDAEHQILGTLLYSNETGSNLNRIAYQHTSETTMAWLMANGNGNSSNVVNKTKTKIVSAKRFKTALKVKWAKKSSVKGYQLQYAANSKFKKSRKITIKKKTTTAKKITKLKKNRKYFVRIRTYKLNGDGSKAWSKWSSAKAYKTR